MRLRKCAITVLLALPFFFSTGLVFAGQQYNPLEDRWETAPDRYQLQYNPLMSGVTRRPEPIWSITLSRTGGTGTLSRR